MTEEEIKRRVSSYDANQFDEMRDYVRGLYPGTVLDSKEGTKRIRFLCPCEGEPRYKVPTQQKRSSKKCGCNYMIYVILKNNKYLVKKCNLEHNDHDLETDTSAPKPPKVRRFYQRRNPSDRMSETSSESSSDSPLTLPYCSQSQMGIYHEASTSAFKPIFYPDMKTSSQHTLDLIAVMSLMELSNPDRLKLDMDSLNTSRDTTFSSIPSSCDLSPSSSVAEEFEFSQRNISPTFENSVPEAIEHTFKRKFDLM